MTRRSLPEWIGASPDSAIPDRVKSRRMALYQDRCASCGRHTALCGKLELDHVIALVNWTGDGHGNRESNLQPLCAGCHGLKTKTDVAVKATAARKRNKRLGITKRTGRPVPGSRDSGWKHRWNKHEQRWEWVRREQL